MKNNKSTLRLSATIVQGSLLYSDKDYRKKLKEFKAVNEGFGCDVIFESHSNPEYWQFKYLYGYVYFAIAHGMGIPTTAREGRDNQSDPGIDEVDRICKEKFLFMAVNSEIKIPRKLRDRCERLYVDYEDPKTGAVKRKIYGIVPSKTKIGYEGLADYIKKCEYLRDGLISWEYEDPAEMLRVRVLAFKENLNEG